MVTDIKKGSDAKKRISGTKLLAGIRIFCLAVTGILYVALFHCVKISKNEKLQEDVTDEKMFKLVDVQEYVAPPKPMPVPKPKAEAPKEVKVVENNAAASEKIVETKEEIMEVEKPAPVQNEDDEYMPQQKVSVVPVVPGKKLIRKLTYPQEAYRQGIEGVVYLELYIDAKGTIRKIKVLKDPGNGFAEAALKAFEGLVCQPAVINGENVAVRYRYPVRFSLK